MPQRIADAGLGSTDDFDSVLEVGCSLGYLLHYMETKVFLRATDFVGIDIDSHAIECGQRKLAALGSSVELLEGDMERLKSETGGRRFDFVLASGILLYLNQASAEVFIGQLLETTNKLLVITAVAHPRFDNSALQHSVARERDGTWIHNVDEMVRKSGGTIVARRWEPNVVDGNTIYFLYVLPGR